MSVALIVFVYIISAENGADKKREEEQTEKRVRTCLRVFFSLSFRHLAKLLIVWAGRKTRRPVVKQSTQPHAVRSWFDISSWAAPRCQSWCDNRSHSLTYRHILSSTLPSSPLPSFHCPPCLHLTLLPL